MNGQMNTTEIISSISSGIIAWYGFNEGEMALYIENNDDSWNEALTGSLRDRGLFVHSVPASELASFDEESEDPFDFIIMVGALEVIADHNTVVDLIKKL